ncbi:FecR family protein [uncultured Polaribacter sp.]|uniref:FecR family protein n=1 Tax=uncultured Polaribacter sp. TaxID=174711 RepID=UPI00262645A9|nr:FecR family protein [uncultured Polaribacter sp.]
MSKDVKKLIVKFISKEANFDELQQLELWISNPKNEALFLEYIKTNAFVNIVLSKYDKVKAKENIIRHIKKEKEMLSSKNKPKWSQKLRYAAAASVVLIIALTIFLNKGDSEPQFTAPVIVNNQIQTGTNKAKLTLANGEEIPLIKGASFQSVNATSNGEEIIYQPVAKSQKPKAKSGIAYNTLTIPRGGQFQMTLADGTQVWLNSESQIKYPVAFPKNQTRQVELIYGEAYFEVSPSTNHRGSKFKVVHKKQEIEVLGTEFNIKAYKDETNMYTTLVEGKVRVRIENENKILKPGEQSQFNTESKIIQIRDVNVLREIAWKDGVFSFKNKSLKEIMVVLSRWYDMEVQFENKALEEITFNGGLKKKQSIIEILSAIRNMNNITYEIKNKTITLK